MMSSEHLKQLDCQPFSATQPTFTDTQVEHNMEKLSGLMSAGTIQLPATPPMSAVTMQLPATPPMSAVTMQLPSTPPLSAGTMQLPSTPPLSAGTMQLPATPPLSAGTMQLPATPPLSAGTSGSTQPRRVRSTHLSRIGNTEYFVCSSDDELSTNNNNSNNNYQQRTVGPQSRRLVFQSRKSSDSLLSVDGLRSTAAAGSSSQLNAHPFYFNAIVCSRPAFLSDPHNCVGLSLDTSSNTSLLLGAGTSSAQSSGRSNVTCTRSDVMNKFHKMAGVEHDLTVGRSVNWLKVEARAINRSSPADKQLLELQDLLMDSATMVNSEKRRVDRMWQLRSSHSAHGNYQTPNNVHAQHHPRPLPPRHLPSQPVPPSRPLPARSGERLVDGKSQSSGIPFCRPMSATRSSKPLRCSSGQNTRTGVKCTGAKYANGQRLVKVARTSTTQQQTPKPHLSFTQCRLQSTDFARSHLRDLGQSDVNYDAITGVGAAHVSGPAAAAEAGDIDDYLEKNDCSDTDEYDRNEGLTAQMSCVSMDDDRISVCASSVCSSRSNESQTSSSSAGLRQALMPSLFSNVPPTINFVLEGDKVERLPKKYRQLLRWKMSSITPNVVRACIARSAFKITNKSYAWLGFWGSHMKMEEFRSLKEYQKFNHFPGSFQLGRKDRLWRNLSRLLTLFGKKEFGFFPRTFVLPADLASLKSVWDEHNTRKKWIVKPPASARGLGVFVINKWDDLPLKRPVIVQQYLSRPYLINGSKFDLRLYVYVTCFDPLRLYVYNDGLVRFASTRYSYSSKHLGNRYIHLTNYSVNKQNNKYKSNSNSTACQGHKWSLKSLWKHFDEQGIDSSLIWSKIKDLIIKTVICAEGCINGLIVGNVRRRYCCHELFGFDILLDENLKPWLIEVNVSPSLHSNSALDIDIKSAMIRDLFNTAGYMLPDKDEVTAGPLPPVDWSTYRPSDDLCIDRRFYPSQKTVDERAKHLFYCQRQHDIQQLSTILDTLTPDDVRILVESVSEHHRCGNFERIFPSETSHKYLSFFEQCRYYNLLLDAWSLKFPGSDPRGVSLLESFCIECLHIQHQTADPEHQWTIPD